MSDMNSPEKSPWGWKAVIIATILSCLFLGFFYIAMSNEPDYMPSQQRETRATAFKNAPVMSKEALAEAEKNKATAGTHDAMQMSDDEMQSMQQHSSGTEHSH